MTYSIDKATLIAIADAIRTKTNTVTDLTPLEMPNAILNIAASSEDMDNLINKTITEYASDNLTVVGRYAFFNCMDLTTVDFPNVTNIGYGAFEQCWGLTTVDFPNVTDIGEAAFYYCKNLVNINFPNVINIKNDAFYWCRSLEAVVFPSVLNIGTEAFSGCNSLKTFDSPTVASLGSFAFEDCDVLETVILRKSDSICTLSDTGALSETLIGSGTGYIYVPSALIDEYKAATNWVTYAEQIRAIEDYPEITGG